MPREPEKSIFRRPGTKCWHVRYTTPDGLTIRRSARTEDYAEAEAFLARLKQSRGLEFTEVVEQFFLHHPLKPNTRAMYQSALRRWHPLVGHLMLDHITEKHVRAFLTARLREVKPQSARVGIRFLSSLFEFARRRLHFEGSNPVRRMGNLGLPHSPERVRWLSDAEVTRALAAASSPLHHDIILTALETGMRLREILNLRVSEVDLPARRIYLPGSRTKSGRGRVVPISSTLFGTVATRVQTSAIGGYVFADPRTGRPPAAAHWWPAIARQAGLTDLHFHDLRHHFASRYVQRGGRLQVLSMLLGHAGVQITTRYAHLATDDMEAEFRRLNG